MDKIKQLSEKKTIASISAFFESAFFPLLLGVVVFLLYALNLPIVTLATLAGCACFICLFAKDTRAGLAVLLFAMISFRYKDNRAAYTSATAIVTYSVLGPLLLFSAIYRLAARRVEWKKKSGLTSMLCLCAAFVLGGAFTKYYTVMNFAYTLGYSATLIGTYIFFAYTMEKREDNLLYLARICAIAICMIALELGEFYLRVYDKGTPLDWIWKDKIVLGWSISNMVGEMIAILIPAVFYLMYKEARGYLYWLVVAVGVVGIYFTYSRNALLWATVAIVILSLVNCFIGENKKIHRAVTVSAVLFAAALVFVVWQMGRLEKLARFFVETGLDDRNRFNVWKGHFELFKESPVHGVGFKAFHDLAQGREHNAHNNLLQMLTSTGVIGLALYLAHRVQTMCVIFKKRTAARLFMGGCIIVGVFVSILSSAFFHIYFLAYYSVILLTLEKSTE